jgi:hypothetical protein
LSARRYTEQAEGLMIAPDMLEQAVDDPKIPMIAADGRPVRMRKSDIPAIVRMGFRECLGVKLRHQH